MKHAVCKGETESDGDVVTTAHDVWPVISLRRWMGQGSAARGVVAAIMVACSGPGTGYCERYRVATSDFLTFSQERRARTNLTGSRSSKLCFDR